MQQIHRIQIIEVIPIRTTLWIQSSRVLIRLHIKDQRSPRDLSWCTATGWKKGGCRGEGYLLREQLPKISTPATSPKAKRWRMWKWQWTEMEMETKMAMTIS